MIRIIALALVFLSGCAPYKPEMPLPGTKPMRIVSMNPCVDSILREIAEPHQIAAISHYSHDRRATSVPLKWALRFPVVSDAAEDVIAADPDLVIAGPHVAVQTVAMLKRLGIPLIEVGVPETVAQSKAQINDIANGIGQQQLGAALNARIDRAIAAARFDMRSGAAPISALIWQGGGLVPGKGTLADEMLMRTGFRNVSTSLGLRKWDILSVEGLLLAGPTTVLSGQIDPEGRGEGGADANRMLSHPVLKKAGARIRIAHYPSHLLHCGGPTIIKSVLRLAQVRREREAKP